MLQPLCTDCATQMRFWRSISMKQVKEVIFLYQEKMHQIMQLALWRHTDYLTHDQKKKKKRYLTD